jgi:hypothetical protein
VKNKLYIFGGVIALILIVSFLSSSFTITRRGFQDTVKTDTIYKTRTITVPEKQGTFTNIQPQPQIVVVPIPNNNGNYNSKLASDFAKLKSDNEKMQKYLEAIAQRVYENKYTSKDSTVTVTVKDTITGFLKSQQVDFNIKERPIEIVEKEIKTTITKYPKFSLSAGLGVSTGNFINPAPSLSANIGFRNKKGWELIMSGDTNKNFSLILKKDIFTKY